MCRFALSRTPSCRAARRGPLDSEGSVTADPTPPSRHGSILQPSTYSRGQWTFN